MKAPDLVRIESALTLSAAADRLGEAFHEPHEVERLFPTRVRLAGRIDLPRVTVYRHRGGSSLFLKFDGHLSETSGHAVLAGRLVPSPPVAMMLCVGLTFLMATIATGAAIVRWREAESALLLAFGLGFVVLGIAIRRFYQVNVQAEADLLLEELEDVLRAPDAKAGRD